MWNLSVIGRSLQSGILLLLSLVGAFAFAQAPVQEQALTQTADDAALSGAPAHRSYPQAVRSRFCMATRRKTTSTFSSKCAGKSTIPLHWHTSAERMVMVAGELHVTYDGQKTAILKPGTYAYGPAKQPHHGFCASTVPCVLFIAFESPLDAVPIENAGK